jgi:hypothetical protein
MNLCRSSSLSTVQRAARRAPAEPRRIPVIRRVPRFVTPASTVVGSGSAAEREHLAYAAMGVAESYAALDGCTRVNAPRLREICRQHIVAAAEKIERMLHAAVAP